MNARHKQILDFIKSNPNSTTKDISEYLNINSQTTLKYLRELKMLAYFEMGLAPVNGRGRPFETYSIKD